MDEWMNGGSEVASEETQLGACRANQQGWQTGDIVGGLE